MENAEIIWQSTLTEEMVAHLTNNEISLLVEALDEVVMSICQDYEVK